MEQASHPGQIVILNGAPRSGKSSIVSAVQKTFDGVWINLGVDISVLSMMPERYRPGIGLRPGGERPDLEPLIPTLYAALYESIAAHSRLGLNVIAEFGHHDAHSQPLGILEDCARRLTGLPVLFVGVRCPVEVIMERIRKGQDGRTYEASSALEPIPEPVRRYTEAVHDPGIYDLEVETTMLSPEQSAAAISKRLTENPPSPSAFERLARRA